MSETLVVQSHRLPLPSSWLQRCLDSVHAWAERNRFAYQFIDDALFDYVPSDLLAKTRSQPVIATDLARLALIQHFLDGKFSTVIWCDADFLIFTPERFVLPNDAYALGREVWIEARPENPENLVARIKVHNAFLLFRRGNAFLDFYRDSAQRLLRRNEGTLPPQFVGPKLLTAIHNVVQCPVMELAGMLSPAVVEDLASGDGAALRLFRQRSKVAPGGANLCHSLFERGVMNGPTLEACMDRLEKTGIDDDAV